MNKDDDEFFISAWILQKNALAICKSFKDIAINCLLSFFRFTNELKFIYFKIL